MTRHNRFSFTNMMWYDTFWYINKKKQHIRLILHDVAYLLMDNYCRHFLFLLLYFLCSPPLLKYKFYWKKKRKRGFVLYCISTSDKSRKEVGNVVRMEFCNNNSISRVCVCVCVYAEKTISCVWRTDIRILVFNSNNKIYVYKGEIKWSCRWYRTLKNVNELYMWWMYDEI